MAGIVGVEGLFRAHQGLVYGYLLRRTGERELAADLVQETFVKAARSILGWSGGNAEGWLLAIARSVLADHWRTRRHTLVPLPDEQELADLGLSALPSDDRVAIEDVLARLPPRAGRLLRAAYLDGFSAAELATMSNMKESAMRMALKRARAAFRDEWLVQT